MIAQKNDYAIITISVASVLQRRIAAVLNCKFARHSGPRFSGSFAPRLFLVPYVAIRAEASQSYSFGLLRV